MEKTIQLIGVPMDLGQNHRGVDMAPSAFRYAGLADSLKKLGYKVHDKGDLLVPDRHSLGEIDSSKLHKAIYQGCKLVSKAASEAVKAKVSPIFLGGDHTIGIGSVSGLRSSYKEKSGVIWIDAHGDSNSLLTSPSGNVHGMSLAILLGNMAEDFVDSSDNKPKLDPKDVVLVGVRDLDYGEKRFLNDIGVKILTMRDIDERGMGNITQEALDTLSHCQKIHVSLDMDCLDPQIAPGVGTPCPGGITYREAQLAMEIIADSKKCSSMDIVEVNPILDLGNKTAQVAVDLATSLAGKTII